MTDLDLVIADGEVVFPHGTQRTSLGIKDGRVALIGELGERAKDVPRLDAAGKWVLPGLVDAHVHFREPGAEHKEDLRSGSMAAAVGGVTSVMDMPTTSPPTTTPEAFAQKRSLIEEKAHVDIAIQAAIGDHPEHMETLARMGAVSFEIFLADIPPPLLVADTGRLVDLLERLSAVGVVVGITPGDDGVIAACTANVNRHGRTDPLSFAETRPPLSEALGVVKAILAAEAAGAEIHFRQISCRASLEALRRGKDRLKGITAEAMVHHLTLDQGTLEEQGPFAKMIPPLRRPEDVEALWAALGEGLIEIVATDHAPHPPGEKEQGLEDIHQAPGGIPGVQTFLPLMLESVHQGRLSLERLVACCAEIPARRFGIFPQKGHIGLGADADLVIVNPRGEQVIDNATQFSKAGRTPYHGWRTHGSIECTLLRGRVIARDGQVQGAPTGKFIARAN